MQSDRLASVPTAIIQPGRMNKSADGGDAKIPGSAERRFKFEILKCSIPGRCSYIEVFSRFSLAEVSKESMKVRLCAFYDLKYSFFGGCSLNLKLMYSNTSFCG